MRHRSAPNPTGGFALPALIAGIGVVSLMLSHATRLIDDEYFYARTAVAISRFLLGLRWGAAELSALGDEVIAEGWRMPGMGILLTPVQLVTGLQASVPAARAWITVVNGVVVYLMARDLLRLGLPRRVVYLAVLLPCALPYYLFQLGMIWGDLLGAHLALLVLVHLERRISETEGEPRAVLTDRHALVVGVLAGAAALVRPQYVLLPCLLIVRIVLEGMRAERDGSLAGAWRGVARSALLVLVPIVVLLAPWHRGLDQRFGPSFMVTSTYLGPLFHDDDFAESAIREYGGNRYSAVQRLVAQRARTANRSFREQADLERERLPERSARERLRRVRKSMQRFYFSENSFLERFLERRGGEERPPAWAPELLGLNKGAWYLLLALGFLAFCAPASPRGGSYLLPLSLKGMVVLLTLQPLVVPVAHGRYYGALIPVFALMFALTLGASPRAAWGDCSGRSAHDRLLRAGQVFALLWGAANVVVFVAGEASNPLPRVDVAPLQHERLDPR